MQFPPSETDSNADACGKDLCIAVIRFKIDSVAESLFNNLEILHNQIEGIIFEAAKRRRAIIVLCNDPAAVADILERLDAFKEPAMPLTNGERGMLLIIAIFDVDLADMAAQGANHCR